MSCFGGIASSVCGASESKAQAETRRAAQQDDIPTFNKEEVRFLQHDFPCDVKFEGMCFPSAEHATQAAKLVDRKGRMLFSDASMTAREARKQGSRLTWRPDWIECREDIMKSILRSKFSDPVLRRKLLGVDPGMLGAVPAKSGQKQGFWQEKYPGMLKNLRREFEVADEEARKPKGNGPTPVVRRPSWFRQVSGDENEDLPFERQVSFE